MAWAEDRATRGRDPSAVPGAKTGDGTRRRPVSVGRLRDWPESDKSPGVWGRLPPATANGCSSGCHRAACGAEGVASGSRSLVAGSIAAVLVGCGRTPSHPFVNWPAACGRLRSAGGGPARTGSLRPSRRRQAVSIRPTPGTAVRPEASEPSRSTGHLRLAKRRGGARRLRRSDAAVPFDERRESDHQELLECVRVFERRPVGRGRTTRRPQRRPAAASSAADRRTDTLPVCGACAR